MTAINTVIKFKENANFSPENMIWLNKLIVVYSMNFFS